MKWSKVHLKFLAITSISVVFMVKAFYDPRRKRPLLEIHFYWNRFVKFAKLGEIDF